MEETGISRIYSSSTTGLCGAIEICEEEPPATEDDFELDFHDDTAYIKTIHFNGNEYYVKKYTDIMPYSICDILGKKDRYTQMKNIQELTRKIGERKKAIIETFINSIFIADNR